jgi:hypothetical protein
MLCLDLVAVMLGASLLLDTISHGTARLGHTKQHNGVMCSMELASLEHRCSAWRSKKFLLQQQVLSKQLPRWQAQSPEHCNATTTKSSAVPYRLYGKRVLLNPQHQQQLLRPGDHSWQGTSHAY